MERSSLSNWRLDPMTLFASWQIIQSVVSSSYSRIICELRSKFQICERCEFNRQTFLWVVTVFPFSCSTCTVALLERQVASLFVKKCSDVSFDRGFGCRLKRARPQRAGQQNDHSRAHASLVVYSQYCTSNSAYSKELLLKSNIRDSHKIRYSWGSIDYIYLIWGLVGLISNATL
jgi:hypothetical protein